MQLPVATLGFIFIFLSTFTGTIKGKDRGGINGLEVEPNGKTGRQGSYKFLLSGE